ncbi:MAG TPA: PIN domain-containing protein [Acidiferrobacter sp.]|nr:PIN domain-containing protein [Acidiferrobacter sp.]
MPCRADTQRQPTAAALLRGGLNQFNQLHMPEDVYLLAATIRARFGLKPPDALHLATAQYHREILWTNIPGSIKRHMVWQGICLAIPFD